MAAAGILAVTLAGCSGGGSDASARPSVDEITEVFTSGAEELGGLALPEDEARCIAEELYESDVADTTLEAFATFDENYEPDAEEQELFVNVLMQASSNCVAE